MELEFKTRLESRDVSFFGGDTEFPEHISGVAQIEWKIEIMTDAFGIDVITSSVQKLVVTCADQDLDVFEINLDEYTLQHDSRLTKISEIEIDLSDKVVEIF